MIALVVIGSLTLVGGYDNRDIPLEPTAPWSEAEADLDSPRDLDFIRNGPENTIPPAGDQPALGARAGLPRRGSAGDELGVCASRGHSGVGGHERGVVQLGREFDVERTNEP